MPRRKKLFAAALCLAALAPLSAAAQRRRATAPAPKPAPAAEAPAEPQAPARSVTVSLKDGTDVKGEYLGADRAAVYVTVAGNRLTLKLDDVAALYFGERPAPAAAPAAAPAPAEVQTTLSFEAGIIYKMGGNQPVARAAFRLLDQPLDRVLAEAGVPAGRINVLTEYAFALKYPRQHPGVVERAEQGIKAHLVAAAETDFSGRGQFTTLKPGTYYLVGVVSTRGGFAVWNVPVEVKPGQNSVFLDQNNAATAF